MGERQTELAKKSCFAHSVTVEEICHKCNYSRIVAPHSKRRIKISTEVIFYQYLEDIQSSVFS